MDIENRQIIEYPGNYDTIYLRNGNNRNWNQNSKPRLKWTITKQRNNDEI